jgi:hypothetical protein
MGAHLPENRDIFAVRLEHDRRLRRLAAQLVPDLIPLDYADAVFAIEKARKLVHLIDGGPGPKKQVSAAAAALYSRLPLENPRDALRTLRIIEAQIRYAEEGVLDLAEIQDLAVYLGAPVTASAHLLLNGAANDCDIIVRPDAWPMGQLD